MRLTLACLILTGAALAAAPSVVRADDPPPAETGDKDAADKGTTDTGPADKDAADRKKWDGHLGDLPFIIGYEKGMKEVELTGKPPMYFFTTTW